MTLDFEPLPGGRLADGIKLAVKEGAMRDVWWYNCVVQEAGHEPRRYSVIVSRDNIRHGLADTPDWRWHVSVAGEAEVPLWRDLTAIAHNRRPGIFLAVGMPPRSMWMNLNPHVLHVHELKDANLIEQFRYEGEAAKALGVNRPS